MTETNKTRAKYYELSTGNSIQFVIFGILIISFTIFSLFLFLPLFQTVVETSLNGTIHNKVETLTMALHDEPQYSKKDDFEDWQMVMNRIIENKKVPVATTNPYTNWAVDLKSTTAESIRYWIDPIISFIPSALILAILLASLVTSWLPPKIGFFRRRIEREIVYNLDNLCYNSYGYYSEEKNKEIEQQLLNADIHDLLIYEKEWGIPIDNLRIIINSLKWINNNIVYKIFHSLKGLNIYLRLYFTEKYNNSILGMVYIGASVLIVIIGFRGLKFIPSTQPSLIFFALGLEFSLLITYAFALIFSKPEEIENHFENDDTNSQHTMFLGNNNKDIERILRVFVKSDKNK